MPKDLLLLQTIKLLSQRLSILEPFYGKTSCLHPEEREIVGFCEAYITMFGEETGFSKFLREKAIPALEKIGMARWPRTELTDLGLRIANRDEKEEDMSEYFPRDIEEEINVGNSAKNRA